MAMVDAMLDRMLRTAKLQGEAFEEVERDPDALWQALGVVVLSSLAAGLGMGGPPGATVVGLLVSVFAWYVWAFLTYWIGTRWLPEPQTSATHGELLRTIGFASGPGIIRVLGLAPALRGPVFLLAALWMLVAGVVAVRQALDYRSTGRAVAVVLIAWAIQWLVLFLLLALFGRPAF